MALDTMTLIQLALKYGPAIKEMIDLAISNKDLVAKIKQVAGPLVPYLEQLGAKFFPNASPALHIVGGVISTFDPNMTKWMQGALNSLLEPSPNLAVDGIYGALTRAAVEQVQKKFGLTVDGIAGTITQSAIQDALAKLEQANAS